MGVSHVDSSQTLNLPAFVAFFGTSWPKGRRSYVYMHSERRKEGLARVGIGLGKGVQ